MTFSGIEKTTLIDYPGKVAATVFTYGCNFRCPFCHNQELVIEPYNEKYVIAEQYVLDFLKLRQGLLDALVITGGEPLLHKDIEKFLKKVKKLDYLIKVDTNGFSPEQIEILNDKNLVDYWAMDVKNSVDRYEETIGVPFSIADIKRSIAVIMNSGVEYEFRTTVVPGLHNEQSIEGIGKLIEGAEKFCIQNFRSGKTIDPAYIKRKSFVETELHRFAEVIKPFVNHVEIRGY